ncbi:MAG: hypothetical protein SNJ85_04395 [Cyanobacteriota bacterium]
MKSVGGSKVGAILACLCFGVLASCTQAKDKNVTSFLPGPIIGIQNPTTPSGGTEVGSSPVVATQPSTSIPRPSSAPTIPPPVPTPDAIPSIVPVPAPQAFAPIFTKNFGVPAGPFTPGAIATLTFTINNANNVGANARNLTGLSFTDNLPAGLVIATPLNFTNNCGGVLTVAAGGSVISLTNGAVLSGASCVITVRVVANAPGSYINPAVTLTSNQAPAAQTAPVNLVVAAAPAPTFVKTFGTNPVAVNTNTALTFTITNTAPGNVPLTDLAFTDTLPAGLVIAPGPVFTNTCGGVLGVAAGGGVISLANGSVAAGATCVITVQVRSAVAGSYTNPVVTLTSTQANPAQSTPVNLIVTP